MFNRDPNQPNRYQPPAQGQAGLPYAFPGASAGATGAGSVARPGFLTMSFVWMFLALLVSAAAAAVVLSSERALLVVIEYFWAFLIAELALVFVINLAINRIGSVVALAMLFVYAILNGATIGIVVMAYAQTTAGVSGVVSAFLGASAIFGAAALYGVVTKRDLTALGGILFMGLIGLIVVSLVQLFLFPGSGMFSLLIGVVGVVIFTGLTAYDVQRINNGGLAWIKSRESASVVGALALYLDFVNLFLMLLRIFGSNRN